MSVILRCRLRCRMRKVASTTATITAGTGSCWSSTGIWADCRAVGICCSCSRTNGVSETRRPHRRSDVRARAVGPRVRSRYGCWVAHSRRRDEGALPRVRHAPRQMVAHLGATRVVGVHEGVVPRTIAPRRRPPQRYASARRRCPCRSVWHRQVSSGRIGSSRPTVDRQAPCRARGVTGVADLQS